MYFIADVPPKHSIGRFSRGPARGDRVRLGRPRWCTAFAQKAALPQFHLEQMSSLCFELGHPAHRQSAIGGAANARTLLVSTDALRIERHAKPEDQPMTA